MHFSGSRHNCRYSTHGRFDFGCLWRASSVAGCLPLSTRSQQLSTGVDCSSSPRRTCHCRACQRWKIAGLLGGVDRNIRPASCRQCDQLCYYRCQRRLFAGASKVCGAFRFSSSRRAQIRFIRQERLRRSCRSTAGGCRYYQVHWLGQLRASAGANQGPNRPNYGLLRGVFLRKGKSNPT